jgi:hypothetical protein
MYTGSDLKMQWGDLQNTKYPCCRIMGGKRKQSTVWYLQNMYLRHFLHKSYTYMYHKHTYTEYRIHTVTSHPISTRCSMVITLLVVPYSIFHFALIHSLCM